MSCREPLFTIGHSSHARGAFLELLGLHRIDAVADVSSQPYSRHYPHFSKQALELSLAEAGVHYVFLGRELGARREERECYVDGVVDILWSAISKKLLFDARIAASLPRERIVIFLFSEGANELASRIGARRFAVFVGLSCAPG